MRVLSVDWDFFFPTPEPGDPDWCFFDWGHKEAPLYIDGPLWPIRAQTFLFREKPLPPLSGEQSNFWSQFNIAADAPLFVAESHAMMVSRPVIDVMPWGCEEVYSFDAHHDMTYHAGDWDRVLKTGLTTCEDWGVTYVAQGARVHVKYPEWKARAFQEEHLQHVPGVYEWLVDRSFAFFDHYDDLFDVVFICRSGAWVPPWHDHAFQQFVASCPAKSVTHIGKDGQPGPILAPRPFSVELVQQSLKEIQHATQ